MHDIRSHLPPPTSHLTPHTQAGFLLSASVGSGGEGEAAAAEAMGLLTEHAYSLLRVVSVHVPRTGDRDGIG